MARHNLKSQHWIISGQITEFFEMQLKKLPRRLKFVTKLPITKYVRVMILLYTWSLQAPRLS